MPKKNKTFHIPYWCVMVSGGDGSAYCKYFTTYALAEAYIKNDPEQFCDNILPPGDVELDSEPIFGEDN